MALTESVLFFPSSGPNRVHHAVMVRNKGSSPPRVMGKKSKRTDVVDHHFLTHVDKIGLEAMRQSLIADAKNPVRMETPLGDSIEDVYDGVHDGPVLGTGVSGMVRRVTRRETGVEYAVKIIDLSRYNTEKRIEQLKNEVCISAEVNHPNIIHLKEVYQSETHLYLVQELCTGGDLFDLLKAQKDRRLSEDDARHLIKQLTSAVKYLHAHNILHRDIKLENFLLLSPTDDLQNAQLKMIDFGVAKHFTPGEIHRDAVGTPYAIAPEVIRRCHSERSDVWAIGVLAFALLSGKTPFGGCDGGNLRAVRDNILEANYSLQDPAWLNVSYAAKDFCMKLLRVETHIRPSSRSALRHEWLHQRPASKPVMPTVVTTSAKTVVSPLVSRPSFQSSRIHPVLLL